jgi:hypothetical protein
MKNSTAKLIKRSFYLKSYFLFPKFTNTIPLQFLPYQTRFIIKKEKKKEHLFVLQIFISLHFQFQYSTEEMHLF